MNDKEQPLTWLQTTGSITMTDLGRMNLLTVSKKVDFGVYLNSDNYGEILLPRKYVPNKCEIGQEINVFIYQDSEDRIIATTQKPKGMVEEFHYLKVKDVNEYGAFLDWGLEKDLFVPFKEQKSRMIKDKSYMVFIFVDERSNRIVASSKLNKFLEKGPGKLKQGDHVEAQISYETDIGYAAIINNRYAGLLYKNEIFTEIEIGQKIPALIKKLREDKLIDLCLQKDGYEKAQNLSDEILNKLRLQGGFMPLNSKSSPEQIAKLFSCSKKTFKMAIGKLYKERLITITEEGIKLS